MPIIWSSFKSAITGLLKKTGLSNEKRTDIDIPMKWVLVSIVVIIILIGILPQIHSGIAGAILMTVFAFFFVTVSSRIVGVVGSSSNPISGMTIATLLLTTLILKALGITGMPGMVAAISVGGLVCIASAIAGDTSQDLKTGYILGATPWKQQIGEFIGVFVSALTIGLVLVLLDKAFGFGTKALPAPQATLMKLVIEGVMEGNLPWGLVFTGAAIALVVEMLGIAALPFAVGLYLPFSLSAPIMLGGVIKGVLDKVVKDKEENKERTEMGILYSSGLIAGEGLMGLIIAILVVRKIHIGFSTTLLGELSSLFFFLALAASLVWYVFKKMPKKS
jgi:putative OPT family oligopeptide transporter